jgi:hypothetical protein
MDILFMILGPPSRHTFLSQKIRAIVDGCVAIIVHAHRVGSGIPPPPRIFITSLCYIGGNSFMDIPLYEIDNMKFISSGAFAEVLYNSPFLKK